jgi:hypothetical protein
MDVGSFGQVNLGPRDVKEAQRVSGGELPRFSGIDYVVRNRGYRRRFFRCWPQRSKGANSCHLISIWRTVSPLFLIVQYVEWEC